MGALEGLGDLQEEIFMGASADELEPNRKAFSSETTGDGDGGNAGEIGGAIGAEEQCACGMILVTETNGFLADERGRDRCGWYGYSVDACIFQGQMELLDEFLAEFEG